VVPRYNYDASSLLFERVENPACFLPFLFISTIGKVTSNKYKLWRFLKEGEDAFLECVISTFPTLNSRPVFLGYVDIR